MVSRRNLVAAAFAVAVTGALPVSEALAQAGFPNRPMKIVVPLTPGGSNDVLGRVMAEKLGAAMGQPVIVENRPGAGGNVGTEYVAKQPADGYTILVSANTHVVNINFFKKLPYDPIKDFAAIIHVANVPNALAVNAPAGTPAAIVARVQSEVVASLAAPDLRERFSQVGAEAVGSTPQQFTDRILADTAKWAKLIKAANVKLQ